MENWMSRIPDTKKLILINIPSTHDSTAYYMNRIFKNFSQTQYYNIKQQLEIGTRKIDIRVTDINKNKEKDEDIICCHGICDCYASDNFGNMKKLTFKSILIDIKNFLVQNPSETVLISIVVGRGKKTENETLKRAYEIFLKYVGDVFLNYDHNLILGDSRGKIILLTYFHHKNDEKRINTVVDYCNYNLGYGTGIEEVHKKYRNYRPFKVNAYLKIHEVKDIFEKYKMTLQEAEIEEKRNTKLFPLNYSVSCTGEREFCLPNPLEQANIVHTFIQKDGVLKKGYYYGWIKMDFANYLSNYKLIDTNFI